jgi:hypothetical protein
MLFCQWRVLHRQVHATLESDRHVFVIIRRHLDRLINCNLMDAALGKYVHWAFENENGA